MERCFVSGLEMAGKHDHRHWSWKTGELKFTVSICVAYDGLHVNMLVYA